MISAEAAQAKRDNFNKTWNREPHDHVPIMARCGTGLLDYAGTNLWETRFDKEKFRKAVFKAYEDGLPVDCLSTASISITPETTDLFRGCVQTRLHTDGITLEHQQQSFMEGDEYPNVLEDVDYHLKNVMIRRKMPFLFEGTVEEAAKVLEESINLRFRAAKSATAGLPQVFAEEYGAYVFGDGRFMFTTPGDVIFDNFRGFKGTLTDLRRHYEEMKQFCEVLWDKGYARSFEGAKLNPYTSSLYMSHIPAFLNPKQFNDLCFKYMKVQVGNLVAGGGKLYILAEGSFKLIFDFLRDLPKDSLLVNVEDDDVCDAYAKIGDCQILIGGSRLLNTKMSSLEENKDIVKRAIDTCAPGNAYMFGSDKSWCCKGDVTPTLVETFKFAAEYGKY